MESPHALSDQAPVSLSLDELWFNEEDYPRIGDLQATVQRYADALEGGAEFPPIIVHSRRKNGKYQILDGFLQYSSQQLVSKRYQKLQKLNIKHHPLFKRFTKAEASRIECVFVDVPDGMSMKLFATKQNLAHGMPLTQAEIKAVMREYYHEHFGIPVVRVAQEFQCSRKVAAKYLIELIKEYKDQKQNIIRRLRDGGMSEEEIATALQKEFPYGTGTSQNAVSYFLTKMVARDSLGENTRATEEWGPVSEGVTDTRTEQVNSGPLLTSTESDGHSGQEGPEIRSEIGAESDSVVIFVRKIPDQARDYVRVRLENEVRELMPRILEEYRTSNLSDVPPQNG